MSEHLRVNVVAQVKMQNVVVDKPKGTQGKGPHHQCPSELADLNEHNYDTLQMESLPKFCHILAFC